LQAWVINSDVLPVMEDMWAHGGVGAGRRLILSTHIHGGDPLPFWDSSLFLSQLAAEA
jgi:hypothetical protein